MDSGYNIQMKSSKKANFDILDDFNSSILDSTWSWLREDCSNWSLTARSGYMRISLNGRENTQFQGEDLSESNKTDNILLMSANADNWSIITTLEFNPTQRQQHAGLIVYGDDNTYLKLTKYFDGFNHRIRMVINVLNYCVTSSSGVIEPATTVTLKINKSGSFYNAYYCLGGDTGWIYVDRFTNVDLSDIKVGLMTQGPAGASVDFDCFQYIPASAQKLHQIPFSASWTLETSDTRLSLGVGPNNKLYISELSSVDVGWNWTSNPSIFPLLNHVNIDGVPYTLNWIFQNATVDESDGRKVTIVFSNSIPSMELASIWHARSGSGPVHQSMTLKNTSEQTITIFEQETTDVNVVGPDYDTSVWYFHSGGCKPEGNGGGTYNVLLGSPELPKTLILDPETEWGASEAPGTFKYQWVPYLVVDYNGNHGIYIGWEWSVGRLSIAPNAELKGARLKVGNGDNFKTDLDAGETFEVPPGFIGAYKGDIDDAGNSLRKYLYDNNMPAVNRTVGYPKVEWNAFQSTGEYNGSWNSVESKYRPYVDTITSMGIEEVMLDVGWWKGDYINQPDSPEADPVDWPSGMLTARNYAYSKGLNFGLYWNNNTSMTTVEGIDQRKYEAKYMFDNYLITSYRCDGTDGNALQIGGFGPGMRAHYDEDTGYWQTKGFYEVIDWLYANVPSFELENCSGGGRIKDFGIMKRSTKIFGSDAYLPLDNLRFAYDSLYMFPPVQLLGICSGGYEDKKYCFRSTAMGAAQIASDTASLTQEEKDQIASCVATYKNKIRPLLHTAKVYHIFPRPDDIQWTGMEFYDPSTQKGVVYIFKPNTTVDSLIIRIKGLDVGTTYKLTFEDGTNTTAAMTGADLMNTGINVVLSGGTYMSELMFIEKE